MRQVAAIPAYLHETYWWAYVHPNTVRLFERQWLVNLILWGNFAKLRDAALRELGETLPGRTLQVDYHRPSPWHPLRAIMKWILRNFEPFAMDLWGHEVTEWLPPAARSVRKETFYGGLYQKLVISA